MSFEIYVISDIAHGETYVIKLLSDIVWLVFGQCHLCDSVTKLHSCKVILRKCEEVV